MAPPTDIVSKAGRLGQGMVEIELHHEGESKIYSVFRDLVVKFGTEFGKFFQYQGVTSITLRDVPFQTFEIFLGWLRQEYEGLRPRPRRPPLWSLISAEHLPYYDPEGNYLWWTEDTEDWWRFAEAAIYVYIFAETYGLPALRQDAIDHFVACNNQAITYIGDSFISPAAITKAYKNTTHGDTLRQLLAIAFCLNKNKEEVDIRNMPKQYLLDTWNYHEFLNPESEESNTRLVRCDYHDHDKIGRAHV